MKFIGRYVVLLVLGCLVYVRTCAANDHVYISTVPAGAKIQINQETSCISPCEIQIAHEEQLVGAQAGLVVLRHVLHVAITLEGYGSKEVELTEGPYLWTAFHKPITGSYWILPCKKFEFVLTPVPQELPNAGQQPYNRIVTRNSAAGGRIRSHMVLSYEFTRTVVRNPVIAPISARVRSLFFHVRRRDVLIATRPVDGA